MSNRPDWYKATRRNSQAAAGRDFRQELMDKRTDAYLAACEANQATRAKTRKHKTPGGRR